MGLSRIQTSCYPLHHTRASLYHHNIDLLTSACSLKHLKVKYLQHLNCPEIDKLPVRKEKKPKIKITNSSTESCRRFCIWLLFHVFYVYNKTSLTLKRTKSQIWLWKSSITCSKRKQAQKETPYTHRYSYMYIETSVKVYQLLCIGHLEAPVDGFGGGNASGWDSTRMDQRTCTSSYWHDFTSSYRISIPLPALQYTTTSLSVSRQFS